MSVFDQPDKPRSQSPRRRGRYIKVVHGSTTIEIQGYSETATRRLLRWALDQVWGAEK